MPIDPSVRVRAQGRVRVRVRGRARRLLVGAVALTLAATLVACASGSDDAVVVTTTASTAVTTTAPPPPACDALVAAAGAVMGAGGPGSAAAGDWAATVGALDAVGPVLPAELRDDWTIVVDRLRSVPSIGGGVDLSDPALLQRYADLLVAYDDPAFQEAFAAIEDFVTRRCPA